MRRRTISSLVLNLSLIGVAGVTAPAIYLRYRAAADPAGIIDGMLRLSWWWPIVFFVALFVFAGSKLDRLRGILPIYLPMLLTLSLVGIFLIGFLNDQSIIVDHPPRTLSRAEKADLARGRPVAEESDFSRVAGVAGVARRYLPPQPFGAARKWPLPLAGR